MSVLFVTTPWRCCKIVFRIDRWTVSIFFSLTRGRKSAITSVASCRLISLHCWPGKLVPADFFVPRQTGLNTQNILKLQLPAMIYSRPRKLHRKTGVKPNLSNAANVSATPYGSARTGVFEAYPGIPNGGEMRYKVSEAMIIAMYFT